MPTLEDIDEAQEQARKMRAIGLLAGHLAHDLNNTLTTIMSVAYDLRRRPLEEARVQQDLEAVDEVVRRLTEMTTQLRQLSDQDPVEVEPFDLNEFVRGLEPEIRERAGASISVTLALTGNMGRAMADANAVREALCAIVDNAIEAMPSGGALTIRTLRGRPGSHDEDAASLISVTDTGRGMSPDERARAFEPFYTTKVDAPRAGLGLASAYAIIAKSRGTISIASEAGRGTTVEVSLLRERAESNVDVERRAVKSGNVVLVVEDEESVRRAIGRVLRGNGFIVLEARGADEALALLSTKGDEVDLLLTDVRMPGMSGPELARKVGEKFGPLRVLFMTGYVGDEIGARGLQDVGTALLKKPFTPEVLLARVRETLGARARYAIQVV